MNLHSTARNAATMLAGSLIWAAAPAFAVVAPPPSFSSLVVLGDSLSDSGRLFALTGNTFPPAPYYQGRFSDGPVAVERLASGLGLSGAQFNNLAIAGARTGRSGSADANIGQATGMLTQLATFQAALAGGPANPNALYYVWGGANDMREPLRPTPSVPAWQRRSAISRPSSAPCMAGVRPSSSCPTCPIWASRPRPGLCPTPSRA